MAATVVAQTSITLGIGASYIGPVIHLLPWDPTLLGQVTTTTIEGLPQIIGFANSDQAGAVGIYFGMGAAGLADFGPPPAAPDPNATCLFVWPVAGGVPGVPLLNAGLVATPIVGPYVQVRYLNGAVAQTTFRLWVIAVNV